MRKNNEELRTFSFRLPAPLYDLMVQAAAQRTIDAGHTVSKGTVVMRALVDHLVPKSSKVKEVEARDRAMSASMNAAFRESEAR